MINFHAVGENNQEHFLQLLEENPMQGLMGTVLTRRPSYLAGQHYFGQEQAFLAEESNQIVGCYQLTSQQGFVNGELTTLGYLNSLRVSQAYRHKISVLKAGFQHLQQQLKMPSYCYTSIGSDNLLAKRLLTRGVAGLPRYHYLGELCTLLIAKRRAKSYTLWQKVTDHDQWLGFYNQQVNALQLAPYVSKEWLASAQFTPLGCFVKEDLQACALLWQQQSFKQVKVAYYHPLIHYLRKLYNGYSYLVKKPCLPKLGHTVPQTFLSFFHTTQPEQIIKLIADALVHCPTPLLTLSLMANNPNCNAVIKAFKPFVYKTNIYRVDFAKGLPWDNRTLHVEAAIV